MGKIKGYYIHFDGKKSIGVHKKIDMQIHEFEKYFQISEIEISSMERTLGQRLIGLLPWHSIPRTYESSLEKLENPDFVYVRRTVADKAYLNFLKEINERFPLCKIIVEIFTYPYDRDEFFKWNSWPFYIKELINRKKLKNYVDRFVTHSEEKEIFRVPTIHATNGICIDSIKPVSGEKKNSNVISMIAVAFMQKHHGYERIIKGMHQYYSKGGKREFMLFLVGDGPEKRRYRKLVKKYKLQSRISFYPTTTNQELDELYEQADLAMGAFGFYKDHVFFVSTIKVKEYMAKGIPVINGCREEVFGQKGSQYYLMFANDSSSLDMNEIACFYDSIYLDRNRKEIIKEIRDYAVESIDMSIAMKSVIQYIRTGE